jgi:hypothetical protein
MRDRWARLPPWARWVLAACLIGFADGTGARVRRMMHGGIRACAAFGYVPVQVFTAALTVLDPLALALMALVRREGWLAVAVTALDVPANWAGNWPAMPRFMISARPDEVLAVLVFATAVPLLRAVAAAALPAGPRPGRG